MSDTYKFLPKYTKQCFNMFDTDMFDYYLKEEMFGQIAYMLHLIIKTAEEGKPLSQFHMEVVDYPFKLWGDNAGRVLQEMKKLMNEDIKAGKYNKPKPLTPEERIAKRLDSLKQFDTVRC